MQTSTFATNFSEVMNTRKEWVDGTIEDFFKHWSMPRSAALQNLKEAVGYSLLKGGKRFRPVLCLMLGESFAVAPKRILPWAMAVEMIHTYSLIHDDLPCMDNDDLRRGAPTNHKAFGETTALLAGDALLTEAFHVIAESYSEDPAIGLKLVKLLGQAAGVMGMVGGQALDLQAKKNKVSLQELNLMHAMKTGALIRVCTEGTAVVCGLPADKISLCREFGSRLGLAFQLKDDLLDSKEKIELGSFPGILGFEETQNYLKEVSAEATGSLKQLGIENGLLTQLVTYNLEREH